MCKYLIEKKKFTSLESLDLALFILAKVGKMEHLKLHKLIFYVASYFLAYFEIPLIQENFKAWIHGPILLSIWHEFKRKASAYDLIKIKTKDKSDIIKKIKTKLTKEQYSFILEVLKEFSKRTAYELECLTHNEKPWRKARKNLQPYETSRNIITKNSIKKYYKLKLLHV